MAKRALRDDDWHRAAGFVFGVGEAQWKSLPFSPWVKESFICGLTPAPIRCPGNHVEPGKGTPWKKSREPRAVSWSLRGRVRRRSGASPQAPGRGLHPHCCRLGHSWASRGFAGGHAVGSEGLTYIFLTPKSTFSRWWSCIHVISGECDWICVPNLRLLSPVPHSLPLLLEGNEYFSISRSEYIFFKSENICE